MGIVESINETPNLTSPQQILRTALELMNNGGRHWIKGKYSKLDQRSFEYSYCSMGAIYQTIKKAPQTYTLYRSRDRALRALNYALHGKPSYSTTTIIQFNDDKRTTWEHVVDLFERAIRALDEGKIP